MAFIVNDYECNNLQKRHQYNRSANVPPLHICITSCAVFLIRRSIFIQCRQSSLILLECKISGSKYVRLDTPPINIAAIRHNLYSHHHSLANIIFPTVFHRNVRTFLIQGNRIKKQHAQIFSCFALEVGKKCCTFITFLQVHATCTIPKMLFLYSRMDYCNCVCRMLLIYSLCAN